MGDVMPRIRKLIATAFALIPLAFVFVASAAQAEKRVALATRPASLAGVASAPT